MTHHTLTITLTDEQYQMLVAQVHYENWWLVTHTDGRIESAVSPASLAAGVVSSWLHETRTKEKKRFDKRFAELEEESKALVAQIKELGASDPGMHSDLVEALDQNDEAYHALTDEWNAFNGPRPTPTPQP